MLNRFDEVLRSTHDDIRVTMRVATDSILLDKLLGYFKDLAEKLTL